MNMMITASMIQGPLHDSNKEEMIYRSSTQSKTRPNIDNVICHELDGDALKDAMFIIDNIREHKMKIKWSAINTWSVKYRHRHVCDLRIAKGCLSIGPVNDVLATRVQNMSYNRENLELIIDALRDSITGAKEAYVLSH